MVINEKNETNKNCWDDKYLMKEIFMRSRWLNDVAQLDNFPTQLNLSSFVLMTRLLHRFVTSLQPKLQYKIDLKKK